MVVVDNAHKQNHQKCPTNHNEQIDSRRIMEGKGNLVEKVSDLH